MKNIVLVICLCVSSTAWSSEPVISGYGIDPYHGYVGIGYDSNIINLKGYSEGRIPGLAFTFGHNYKPWLDLEFRASTASGYIKAKTGSTTNFKYKYNYNLTGLLKFKWQPTQLLDFNLLTGLNYMETEKAMTSGTTQYVYDSGLVLGGGFGFNLTPKFSLNADYLTYQRNSFMGSSEDTWDVANLSLQYHF
ncbi:outer membrane beta-barrel protein [Hydrogenovibrio kuenenii]|uniref:outer membrane beta-barrel protein n=1 Tax=Hydrogenovibrio kuenenii TaxID=63658 RepID=UPI0004664B21|nr:outer membrane beta-barrel protein [Hydrogenovibrio kuenenii]